MPFEIQQDPALVRISDEPVIAGDTAKFRSHCLWNPEIPLSITLDDTLQWWRVRLAATTLAWNA